MMEVSTTPCISCLVQNISITHPTVKDIISDRHVTWFVMVLGVILILCSLIVNGLSHHPMASRQLRGAGLLRQFISLGDLLGGAAVFLLLLYAYQPYYFNTSNNQKLEISCVNFKSPDLITITRMPLTLLLVAFARHIHTNLVFMQEWRHITIGSVIKTFLPAIIGLCLECIHMAFAKIYPKLAHRMVSSLPWPTICVQSRQIEVFNGAMIVLPCVAITIILLIYLALDIIGIFRRSPASPIFYTKVVDVKEINSKDKSFDEKLKEGLLLGSDYSALSKLHSSDNKDFILPLGKIQDGESCHNCSPDRTSMLVSANAFILTTPLILSMTVVPFDNRDHQNCLTFILMLLRWTYLSVCNVCTCLYYISIASKK